MGIVSIARTEQVEVATICRKFAISDLGIVNCDEVRMCLQSGRMGAWHLAPVWRWAETAMRFSMMVYRSFLVARRAQPSSEMFANSSVVFGRDSISRKYFM